MAKKTYVGVNNIARNVSKMYVGVNGVARRVKKAYVGVNGVARQVYEAPLKIVTFNGGTEQEIYDMLEAHYKGVIDVSNYWSVGDSRTIHLSAMAATNVGESHRAQDMIIEIVDFKHDELSTSINGITKAAVTIACKNCLRDATVSDTDGLHNTEMGYINSTDSYINGWHSSNRRNWCNNVFYNALPYYIKSGVKSVRKYSYAYNSSGVGAPWSDNDYAFLGSLTEYLGSQAPKIGSEGDRYSRYNTTSNLAKLPKATSSDISSNYYTRSGATAEKSYGLDKTKLIFIISRGNLSYDVSYSNSSQGISPMFCM